jgi:Predicted nuclease of the RecB family
MVGSIDILGEDKLGNLVVVEVKRGEASPEAVHQLKRYVEYIKGKNPGRGVRGILVATGISTSAYRYLKDYGLEFRRYTHANIINYT